MELQKRLAAQALNCGINRVKFNPSKLKEIKEAITSFDIQRLINQGIIDKHQKKGISRARAKQTANQKKKGRQSGHGSRKGTAAARKNPKTEWVRSIRTQRELLKKLRDKKYVSSEDFKDLYAKAKGGFFRSTQHIKIYIEEQDMVKKQ